MIFFSFLFFSFFFFVLSALAWYSIRWRHCGGSAHMAWEHASTHEICRFARHGPSAVCFWVLGKSELGQSPFCGAVTYVVDSYHRPVGRSPLLHTYLSCVDHGYHVGLVILHNLRRPRSPWHPRPTVAADAMASRDRCPRRQSCGCELAGSQSVGFNVGLRSREECTTVRHEKDIRSDG
ncbi:hypothetical protein FN846DRAFT_72010 [Sphaerosporella brunnea]|uniref:Secreted protein n=1 Tax=Sphaerosporella brunnea TaxID=1250544 RepID=A0A5J5ETT6_9PEZI|nr:hypothetical protein FN846DRAFT_72010 [Sphaerosporella brunnea]